MDMDRDNTRMLRPAQPWCDGSHRKRLVELRMQGGKVKNDYLQVDPGTYPICNCKYTDNPPFCDESCQKF
jgi:CDGSH-type Zn-finger protein